MEISGVKIIADKIKDNISRVIVGKKEAIDVIITSLIAGGHVLLEDVPGTGKTMLAKALSKSVGTSFKRVQFTPDLLPSDLTGINYYNQKLGEFTFRMGPIFTNILLADEINRATPRTQSSLLECMEERQVTIDGKTYKLTEPFFVIATQNPIENQGTFPLPEAQLDRFFVKVNMGYPTIEEGKKIFQRFIMNDPLEELKAVCEAKELVDAKKAIARVYVSEDIQDYMLKIINRTLEHESVILGVSPRGSLALLKACQVYAAINGRNYVSPDDVKIMALYVLPHRLILNDSARVRGVLNSQIIKEILSEMIVPSESLKDNKETER